MQASRLQIWSLTAISAKLPTAAGRQPRTCGDSASGCERFDVRDAVDGLAGWSFQVDRCRSERELVTELLDRHHRVQSGKMDGGMPKRDWIASDSNTLLAAFAALPTK